ncbi:GspH/FimT family pseudopilin [Pseudomonas alcaligenes]|uniref:GspH/FimT family pseudopilin n=1 Tax=Aquipseudomonas alcaligenes TaxID=43263 RepID=UPI00358E0A09
MLRKNQIAFSLLETILTISLLSLAIALATPNLVSLINKNRQDSLRETLLTSLHQGRAVAILNRQKVEICASTDGLSCVTDWRKGWMTRRSGDTPTLLHRFQTKPDTHLEWTGFGKTILFHPNGTTPASNGRFYQCAEGKIAWQLILNRQGRVRQATRAENLQASSRCTK